MQTDVVAYLSGPLAGVALIGLGWPLARRRVAPNGALGIRLPTTLASSAVWYGTNARAGADLIRLGVLLVGVGLVLPWLVGRPAFVVEAVIGCAGLILVYVRAASHARRLFEGLVHDEEAREA